MPVMITVRPAAVLLLLLSALLIGGCADGGTVQWKMESDPHADGTVTYTIRTSNPGVTHERITTPDDPWVEHCFDLAVRGESAPYYCTTERTVVDTWMGGITAAASLGVTWLLTLVVAVRLPSPAFSGAAGAEVWLFERTEAEKRAYHPIRRELARMAVSRYGFRAALISVVLAFATAYTIGSAGPEWIEEWLGASGVMHVALYSISYIAWIFRGTLSDEVRQTRLAIGIGVGIGLFAASFALAPGG